MTYREQLQDPRWQKRRLQIMQRDEFRCLKCGSETRTLNVHHVRYERGRSPWEYPDDDLHTICTRCHLAEHARTDDVAQRRAVAQIGEALRLAAADADTPLAPVVARAIALLEEAFPA